MAPRLSYSSLQTGVVSACRALHVWSRIALFRGLVHYFQTNKKSGTKRKKRGNHRVRCVRARVRVCRETVTGGGEEGSLEKVGLLKLAYSSIGKKLKHFLVGGGRAYGTGGSSGKIRGGFYQTWRGGQKVARTYLSFKTSRSTSFRRRSNKLAPTPLTKFALSTTMMPSHMSVNTMYSQAHRVYGVPHN